MLHSIKTKRKGPISRTLCENFGGYLLTIPTFFTKGPSIIMLAFKAHDVAAANILPLLNLFAVELDHDELV
jgi:hypothetical protein